jgi:hypothetical protein
MPTFDDRDKGFENKFAHDEETAFKIEARCNRMLGSWVAEKLGKTGEDIKAYSLTIVEMGITYKGLKEISDKIIADLAGAGVTMTAKEIEKEFERLMPIARQEITGA